MATAHARTSARREATRMPPIGRLGHPVSPGSYMRSCRERSGKSIEECARAIAPLESDARHARNDLTLLEDDRPGNYYRLARSLRHHKVFAFDMSTFLSLAAQTCNRDEWGAS